MALLLLKSVLFPRRDRAGYTPVGVRSRAPTHVERGSSDEYAVSDDFQEKAIGGAQEQHSQHFRISPRIISDATIGLSDGLTVPFALTAGLSALGDTRVVIYGGLAELIAGGISMGLGGYLGAKSEAEAYYTALAETRAIVASHHARAADMAQSTFGKYHFPEQTVESITSNLLAEPEKMVDFLMCFHHRLAEADHTASRAYISGLTISLGYVFGGLVPLVPYLFSDSMQQAFTCSVVVMAVALFAFGCAKAFLIREKNKWTYLKNGLQTMLLGGVAAGAAMGCVKAVGS